MFIHLKLALHLETSLYIVNIVVSLTIFKLHFRPVFRDYIFIQNELVNFTCALMSATIVDKVSSCLTYFFKII